MGDFTFCYEEFEFNCHDTFKQLWKDRDFTNVTLAAGDGISISAHKVVLLASSPLLKKILQNNPHQSPLIYLHNILSHDLELLLQFIYLGQCRVNQDNLVGFLEAGKQLQIKGLAVKEKQDRPQETLKEEFVGDRSDNENDVRNEPLDIKKALSKPETSFNEEPDQYQCNELAISDKPFVITFNMTQEKSAPRFLNEFEYNGEIFVKDGLGQFSCKQCTVKFNQSLRIIKHIQAKHDKIKHLCKLCDFQTTYPTTLSDHVLAIHKGIKFKCDHCHFEANNRPTVSLHTNAQHKGLTFDCNSCDFKAIFERILRRHEKAKHHKKGNRNIVKSKTDLDMNGSGDTK